MLLDDIIAIRDRCATDAEKAQIDTAIDMIGDTFQDMVKAFEKSATGGSKELADLGRAREALRMIRAKDTEHVLPEFETDSALAIFVIRFAREVVGR